MKRVVTLLLCLLLVLPCLALTVFAASPSAHFVEIVDGYSFFRFDDVLSSGWYVFNVYLPAVPVRLISPSVFLNFVPTSFHGFDGVGASFVTSTSVPGVGRFDVEFTFFNSEDTGMIVYAPVLFPDAAYTGSSVSVESAQKNTLPNLTAVASAVIEWVGQIAAAIVEHPFLLVTVGIFFVGGCIALFGRLLSRN